MHLSGVARLGRDAEVRYTQQQEPVASLALAFDFMRGKEKQTQWVEASLWGKRAESLQQYLSKGEQFYFLLEAPHIETYHGKNGEGYKMAARVIDIRFVGKKDEATGQHASQSKQPDPPRRQASPPPQPPADIDDDIPFAPIGLEHRSILYCI
jgi:single-strand DNA-binding protein